MDHVESTVTLPNGVRLAYVEQGDPAGLPVVFLHGVTDSWRSFEPVLGSLPGWVRAFALSQRGHGDSDKPASGYRARDFAADLDAFLTAMGVECAVVVGHSMGSLVAQRFAVDHPDRVLGLVLVGAQTTWRDHPDVHELREYIHGSMQDPVDPQFVAGFQRSTIVQPVAASFFDTVVEESLKLPARVWRAAFDECVMGPEDSSRLAEIRVPALLVCGAEDTIARDGQAALVAAIPGAQLTMYPRIGHALHWEEPGRFASDLVEFIARIRPRSSDLQGRASSARGWRPSLRESNAMIAE